MDVSIIIINYNTRQMTAECIDSIIDKTSGLSFEIIVVDNASTDGSKDFFSRDNRIIYVYNSENLGFGRANNIGAKHANGKYLFLLNSDTILVSNAIEAFYSFMENNKDIASCGANLVDENGKMTVSHGNFPSLLQELSTIGFYKLYKKTYRNRIALGQFANEGNISDVDYISGADIFIRRNIFERLNGFDRDYFMYYEETDLYYRMSNSGYRSCLIPSITIIHKVGGSFSNKRYNISKFNLVFNGKLLFYYKHRSLIIILIMRFLSALAIITHFYVYKKDVLKALYIVCTQRRSNVKS